LSRSTETDTRTHRSIRGIGVAYGLAHADDLPTEQAEGPGARALRPL
jgi:hypothetical protein